MSDVTQDHPEFFKPPAPHDLAPNAPEEIPESEATEASQGLELDDLLATPPAANFVAVSVTAAKMSNRKAAALIAVVGGFVFAVLYAAAALGLISLRQDASFVVASSLAFLSTPIYWLTTALFTGLFVLLAIFAHRRSWTFFVWGSFVVGALTYAAALGAGLIAIHAWDLTFAGAQTALWEGLAFNPLILIAPVIARETSLWLGLWISHRAKNLRSVLERELVSQ